jgi:hypothetical protein
MSGMVGRIRTFAGLLLLTVSLAAQREAPVAPERIHIIGASVSGGFMDGPLFGAEKQGQSVSLHRMLKKWCDGEVKVTTHPPMEMWMLFQDPVGTGEKEIALAKRRKPDAVVAIDFPFWFAYGYVRGDENEARTKRFERGLALLAQLDGPLVVGDLPDMRGAAVRMLKPQQIPSAAILKQLNERLAAWAKQREDVLLVPLSRLVHELKVDGVELPLKQGKVRTAPAALLQEDRLHATRLGMAMLTFRLQEKLQHLFPKAHALHGHEWTFEQFVEAAGAEVELEGLLEAAAEKKK